MGSCLGRSIPFRHREPGSASRHRHHNPSAALALFCQLASRLPAPDTSTIYRTLETLSDYGLIAHLHLSGTVPSYVLAENADHP
jgi:Fe2+ or Zn2+ uptake regulation protein